MNKLLSNRFVRYAFIAIMVSLIVYDFYYIPNRVRNEQELASEYLSCPYSDSFNLYWNAWSYEYLIKNPSADIEKQMNDWNSRMIANNCGLEWLNPFGELRESDEINDIIQQ